MIIHDVEQRSDEWRALRLGKLTGTAAGDMMATIKSGEAAARRNLRTRLVLERLTGVSQESEFESADMRRGRELEDEALVMYEAEAGALIERVGFVAHDTLAAGCSPDGFVGAEGLVEIKVPKSATHLEYLKGGLPAEYKWQALHGLWLTERSWCDFVSYDPRFPAPLRLAIQRITWRHALVSPVIVTNPMAAYELIVRNFLREVDDAVTEVGNLALERQEIGG